MSCQIFSTSSLETYSFLKQSNKIVAVVIWCKLYFFTYLQISLKLLLARIPLLTIANAIELSSPLPPSSSSVINVI